jgi:hypothetical protein
MWGATSHVKAAYCKDATITCAWPPRAGRLERIENPSLLEAMAYTLLAMSESGHFRRSGRVPNGSGVTQLSEARNALRHLGVAPNGDALAGEADAGEARHPKDDLLSLWTALPLQVDFDVNCVASCKHLSGVSWMKPGRPNGESARARLYSW